jgi:hypothetical protein
MITMLCYYKTNDTGYYARPFSMKNGKYDVEVYSAIKPKERMWMDTNVFLKWIERKAHQNEVSRLNT